MNRRGSLTLAEYPGDVVRIECPACGRSGRYGRDGLIERFGADAALPDLLLALAACARRDGFSGRYGARFSDLGR
jgi:hypothetical protein